MADRNPGYSLAVAWRQGDPVETEMATIDLDGEPARALMIDSADARLTGDASSDPATVAAKLVFTDGTTSDPSGAEFTLGDREVNVVVYIAAEHLDDLQRRLRAETAAEITVTFVRDEQDDRIKFDTLNVDWVR